MVDLDTNKLECPNAVVCKNVVEKFVTITLLLKGLMILLKEVKCNFIEKIANIDIYVYTNILF